MFARNVVLCSKEAPMSDEQLAQLIERLAAAPNGWQGWVERLGVPVAILVVVVVAIAKVAKFLAPLIREDFEAHTKFLSKTEQKLTNDSTAIKSLADAQASQTELVEQQAGILAELLRMRESDNGALLKMQGDLERLTQRVLDRRADTGS